MLANGMLLQGRYRIKRPLAHGGMGAVYEAEAVHLGAAPVAVEQTFTINSSERCASSSSARRRRWLDCVTSRRPE